MLETCLNQAAGLQGMAAQTAAPRVIAMASHGKQQGELPLLWNLCSTLVDFGYPVAVLDATTAESDQNPGLEQLLDDTYWRDDEAREPLSWSVVPSARGLQRLCARKSAAGAPLDPLGGLLQSFGVIVIYARAEVLTLLLADSGIEPLLTVSPLKMSPVTAYQALKQMLINAKLRPTIASLMSDPVAHPAMAIPHQVKKLQECAMTFLGYRLDTLTVCTQQVQDQPSDDMSRLALRLLEKAMPLHRIHSSVGSH
jgi:hypothetical protein